MPQRIPSDSQQGTDLLHILEHICQLHVDPLDTPAHL